MKDGQAFIICAEMKHHPYNLKGSTLEVFSALYCLTRKRAFLGTYIDLANWIEIEPKTLRRALKVLNEKDLVSIDKSESGFDRYEFQAHHIKGYPLPDYRYSGKRSYTNAPIIDSQNLEEYQNEIEATGGVIDPTEGQNVSTQGQNVQKGGQNVQHNNTIYNTMFNKERKKKENNYYRSAPYEVSPEVLALEEQMREQRRKEREQADREANTPEAIAARDAFFEKFVRK